MNNFPSPQKGEPTKDGPSNEGVGETIKEFYPEENIAEGGEFLDDSLRMREQPLEKTEEKKTNHRIISYRHLF